MSLRGPLPDEVVRVGLPLEEGPGVEAAPQREPLTPGEWVRRNLFSSAANTAVTILVGLAAGYLLFRVVRFVFVTAEWEILRTYLRAYMIGRFPLDQAWRVWLGLYVVMALAGLSRGALPAGTWSTRRLVATGLGALLGVGTLLFLVRSALVWALTGVAVAIAVAGVWIGRRMDRRLRKPLLVGWLLAFPFLFLLLTLGPVRAEQWGGLLLNVMVASVAIPLSFPIGLLLALGRRSSLPLVSWFCVGVIEIVRGVPLVTLLIFGRFVLILLMPPQLSLAQIVRAMMMFTVFSAAYVAEIVRGGLQGVPEGQYEAARALGLSTTKTMGLIALPQALRSTIPPMIGHFISVFKDTSLLAALGIFSDLLATARRASQDLQFLGLQAEALLPAALAFWLIAFSMSRWSQRVERRLAVRDR